MEEETRPKYYEDEIDLYELCLVIKKRGWLISLITLLSFCTAFGYCLLTPKIYKTSNIVALESFVSSNPQYLISTAEIKSIITMPLETLSPEKKADLWGMDTAILKDIKDIKTSKIKEVAALRIDVNTIDRKAGVRIIDALVHYINTRPIVQQKIEQKKRLLQENKQDLKEIIDNPYNGHGLPDGSIIYDPATSLYALREKYNTLCFTLNKLEKGQVVRLADKTIVPEKPYKPKKKLVVPLGIVIGLFLGIFAAFFMEWLTNARSKADQGLRV